MTIDNSLPLTEIQSTNHIFLSYNRADREACNVLRKQLEQAGLATFHDVEQIRIGDQWLTHLQKALQECSVFILLIGRDGAQRWVGAELQVALIRHFSPHGESLRLPIFPILLGEAPSELLPPFLALFQIDRWSPDKPLSEELIAALKARTMRFDDRQLVEGCPFLGLSAFSKKDAKLFFGRRKETLEALTTLGNQQHANPDNPHPSSGSAYIRWLQIEGNSGSGKSSLVNAGMLPMIEQGALWSCTGIEHWRILGPMMPGQDPLAKLAETLELGLIEDPAKRDIDARLERFTVKDSALASTIRNFKQEQTAFLLIVDQFEELFTFAGDAARKQFDVLLAYALQDPECPLFLISTVRADFLERFEYLPHLQAIYNSHCKRYFLPLISEQGLREIIEQPAHLAGLDVSEVKTAILEDTKDEVGALPLVENGLFILWQHRQGNKLSGEYYRQKNGIAGMLSDQADDLLQRIDDTAKSKGKGKLAALELLLRLTRINDEGRHARQRITREEAIAVAGNGDDELGEQVVRMLSGERAVETLSTGHSSVLRLITLKEEQELQHVDLIHETLIRARAKDKMTRKLVGYWPTLYDYIEKNRDRDIYRQQLKLETTQWQQSKGLGRLWNLKYFGLRKYRALRIPKNTNESRFIAWSQKMRVGLILLLIGISAYTGESFYWTRHHELPLDMMWTQQRFRLGYAPIPELVSIPAGSFNMGEQEQAFIEILGDEKNYFGVPGKPIQINRSFSLGKTEVTYEQFDYYVWRQQRNSVKDSKGKNLEYPTIAKGGRGNHPVVNVDWHQANSYAKWLGEQIELSCRLPTEAEWEYAAQAGKTTAYPWGNDIGVNNANCSACGSQWDGDQAAPIGIFQANSHGLYDMSGNVWEWTCSEWREQFDGSEQQCSGDATGLLPRVVRGGSWDDHPDYLRVSSRNYTLPANRANVIGFRVLCLSHVD